LTEIHPIAIKSFRVIHSTAPVPPAFFVSAHQPNISVYTLSKSETHNFSKASVPSLTFVVSLGVNGDYYSGVIV